jgi:S1-C subfamily serine protease
MWEGGFLPGDVIYSINGLSITNLEELRSEVANLGTYDPIVIQIERMGELQFIAFEIEGE